jgi:hypothetical protein
MQYFTERMKHAPSLLGLSSLRVIGDVWFGKDVVLQVLYVHSWVILGHFVSIQFVRSSHHLALDSFGSDFPVFVFFRERLLSGPRKTRGLRSQMARQSKTRWTIESLLYKTSKCFFSPFFQYLRFFNWSPT